MEGTDRRDRQPRRTGGWLPFVAGDGGVFDFNLPFVGSLGGQALPAPIVGMAPSTARVLAGRSVSHRDAVRRRDHLRTREPRAES